MLHLKGGRSIAHSCNYPPCIYQICILLTHLLIFVNCSVFRILHQLDLVLEDVPRNLRPYNSEMSDALYSTKSTQLRMEEQQKTRILTQFSDTQ